jgi:hypothetical protein
METYKKVQQDFGEAWQLIRRGIPRLCRGGSKSLTNPGVRFTRSPIIVQPVAHGVLLLTLTGCDQTPLRGQQP